MEENTQIAVHLKGRRNLRREKERIILTKVIVRKTQKMRIKQGRTKVSPQTKKNGKLSQG